MEDCAIVDLYWARDERAISESDAKYGRMLSSLSYSLTSSNEDAEECVSDTYLAAWNNMPEDRPDYLGAYLSKIVRRLSINRFRSSHRQKRGGGAERLIDELCECIPDSWDVTADFENGRLRAVLNGFIGSLPKDRRDVFVLRYFCSKSVYDIACQLGFSEGKVKTLLHRTRTALKKLLEEEGLPI
ncbi:MAG: sigma-70 family RNA polymerase sigma factor [Clostridia bacterium]|nr:sigma-70 family RNA polymerase sigma factor [Clostridia bacterium]